MQSRGSDPCWLRYGGVDQHRAERLFEGGLAGGEVTGAEVAEADVEALMKSLIMAIVQALVDKPGEVSDERGKTGWMTTRGRWTV